MHRDKGFLLDAMDKIRHFLKDELSLTLHPQKWSLQPVTHEFQFLGAYILPGRVYPNRRVERNFLARTGKNEPDGVAMASYGGYFRHFDCYRRIYEKFFKQLENGSNSNKK